MKPTWVYQLSIDAFRGAKSMCQGKQIAAVVSAIVDTHPSLVWFSADVQGIGATSLPPRSSRPVHIGETDALLNMLSGVDQFESGVFVGCKPSREEFRFREGGLWTEDEEDADLGDAIVEIRAFDTTFIEVATSDNEIGATMSKAQF